MKKPYLQGYTLTLLLGFILLNNAHAQSLLWKISGNDLQNPSYLYGTIHLTDCRIFEWKDSVFSRLESCQAFAGELDLGAETIHKANSLIMLPEGISLHDRFSPDEYRIVQEGLKECSGFDLQFFNRLKPPALIALCFANRKEGDMEVTVDEWLFKKATISQKIIFGIETIEEQMAVLELIPDQYVLEYFRNTGLNQLELEKLIDNYRNANLDSLLVLLQDEESGSMLNDELIRLRNYRMTDRVIPMMKKYSVFIAVGCGHLPGHEGIIALLRKQGYVVEAVDL